MVASQPDSVVDAALRHVVCGPDDTSQSQSFVYISPGVTVSASNFLALLRNRASADALTCQFHDHDACTEKHVNISMDGGMPIVSKSDATVCQS